MGKKYQPQPISEVPAQLRFQCCDHPDVFNRTTVEEEPYIIISFGVTRSIFSDGFFNDFFDMNIPFSTFNNSNFFSTNRGKKKLIHIACDEFK